VHAATNQKQSLNNAVFRHCQCCADTKLAEMIDAVYEFTFVVVMHYNCHV